MTSIQVRQVKEDLQSEKVQSPEGSPLLPSREDVTWWVCACGWTSLAWPDSRRESHSTLIYGLATRDYQTMDRQY